MTAVTRVTAAHRNGAPAARERRLLWSSRLHRFSAGRARGRFLRKVSPGESGGPLAVPLKRL